MAVVHGKDGQVKVGGTAFLALSSWTLTVTLDNADASVFGTDWRQFVAGMRSWNGSADGYYDPSDTAAQTIRDAVSGTITKVSLELFTDLGNTKKFSGSAWITEFSQGNSIDGIATFSFNFQGDGTLTVSVT